MKTNKRCLLFLFALSLAIYSYSQPAFTCDGTAYVSKEKKLFAIDFNWETGETELTPFPGSLLFSDIGALGYNRKDNFIYALGNESNESTILLKIDAEGNAHILDTLNISGWEQSTGNGAISNDGNTFIFHMTNIHTITPDIPSSAIGVVELNTPDYKFTIKPLKSQFGELPLLTSDLAFDPITDSLFGYSHFPLKERRLVYLNRFVPSFDDTFFPITNIFTTDALFFDAFGQLWGFNYQYMHKINTSNGLTQTKEIENISPLDGCSCPYTVKLQKTVSQDTAFTCSEVFYTFKISNFAKKRQSNVMLRDSFPLGFEILEIVYNPFGGIQQGIGTNQLTISNMELPYIVDSIVVLVRTPEKDTGIFFNQASLYNVDLSSGNNPNKIVYSDFPFTLKRNDPTPVVIKSFNSELRDTTMELCKDSVIILNPIPQQNNFEYSWSDGTNEPTLTVADPGMYSVTVNSACSISSATFDIKASDLSVDLNTKGEVEFGTTIQILPFITSMSNIASYQWEVGDSVFSTTQSSLEWTPDSNIPISLTVTNESGCRAGDWIKLKIVRHIFTPNAFSPNHDGINDWFFIQTKVDIPIKTMRVFNRWGNLVFEKQHFFTNSEQDGWNGKYKNDILPVGVYVWWAELDFGLNGVEVFNGDVLLLSQ